MRYSCQYFYEQPWRKQFLQHFDRESYEHSPPEYSSKQPLSDIINYVAFRYSVVQSLSHSFDHSTFLEPIQHPKFEFSIERTLADVIDFS